LFSGVVDRLISFEFGATIGTFTQQDAARVDRAGIVQGIGPEGGK